MQKNQIIPQMFDVRPVDETGDLDWNKINSIGASIESEPIENRQRQQEYANKKLLEKQQQERVHAENMRIQEQQRKIVEFNRLQKELVEIKLQEERRQLEKQRAEQIEADRKKAELVRREQEKMQRLIKERDAAILAEKIKAEQLQKEELRKNAEILRQQELARIELARLEREKKDQEYQQLLAEKKAIQEKETLEKIQLERFKKAQSLTSSTKKKKHVTCGNENFKSSISWKDFFSPPQFAFQFDLRQSLLVFFLIAFVLSLGVGGISYASKGIGLKGKVLGVSTDGYQNLTGAVSDMVHQNFEGSSQQFSQALANFSEGSDDLENMGGILLDATRFVPFASKISSGKNAVEAGKHFSAAGKAINEVVKDASGLKNPIDASVQNNVSLLDVLKSAQTNIAIAKTELDSAQKNIDQISVDDLPKDKQNKFILLKQKLPDIRNALDLFLNNSNILYELLGGNGPRKYLFLFQNNSEMRATGGFVGSYGLLDIANGHVKKFFIDGIFNPDGQLRDKIVPPGPIQKISANWSMHDSNWFPDFPKSAQKAINFYEKTGGPTADGVISFTPTLMQKLLEITGPIEMPDYGVTLDSKNFVELTQFEVEVDYDKQENKPKKILSDLAPLLLEKLLSSRDMESISKMAEAILDGLQEKHVLFYSQNSTLQGLISKQGWSGEVLPASKDYVSVINTNINGFKTDAVVEESISHKAQIQSDGSIIDTLSITRKHSGGQSQYEWLNKVNADYMRVYVPQGSKLIDVSGQTREVDKEPLDYDALGFKRDVDVQKEEQSVSIDPESGTRIYDDSDKTVFANWVYVSPGESVTVTYKYLLPFSLFKVAVGSDQQIDSYSLVAQKQSGSAGSGFVSSVTYPSDYSVKWNFPQEAKKESNEIKIDSSLKTDRFVGVAFEKD